MKKSFTRRQAVRTIIGVTCGSAAVGLYTWRVEPHWLEFTYPTLPIAAPRIGEKEVIIGGEKETVRSALVRLNRPANLTGHPAISIPCGFTRGGLPIGLQLIGPHWSEARLLSIALAYEDATEWHKRRPQLA